MAQLQWPGSRRQSPLAGPLGSGSSGLQKWQKKTASLIEKPKAKVLIF